MSHALFLLYWLFRTHRCRTSLDHQNVIGYIHTWNQRRIIVIIDQLGSFGIKSTVR